MSHLWCASHCSKLFICISTLDPDCIGRSLPVLPTFYRWGNLNGGSKVRQSCQPESKPSDLASEPAFWAAVFYCSSLSCKEPLVTSDVTPPAPCSSEFLPGWLTVSVWVQSYISGGDIFMSLSNSYLVSLKIPWEPRVSSIPPLSPLDIPG